MFQKPPQGTPGVLKQGRRSGVLDRGLFGFEAGAEFPDEAGELAGDGGLDLVVMHASFAQHGETVAEAGLGFPGEFLDPAGRVALSLGELGADLWRDAVVGGLFDEQPAGVGVAALADGALFAALAAGVFGGHETEEGHEFLGMLEAAEGADFRHRDHGGDEFEALEGHEPENRC